MLEKKKTARSETTSSVATKIFAVVNQKGGVGKTTTSVNLATAMAAVGKKVLIIDFDPQGNASTGLGIAQSMRDATSYEVLLGEIPASEAILPTSVPNLSIMTANMNLSGAEIELVGLERREFLFKDALQELPVLFDYIIVDCPPSLGLITLNALVAAHAVLIPLQCEFYALEGLSHLMRTVDLLRSTVNPELAIRGIVLTMVDRRNKCTEQIEAQVREYFGELVFAQVIPRNVRMSEAPSHGLPAMIYDMHCSGSRAYILLAKELLKRERNEAAQKQHESEVA